MLILNICILASTSENGALVLFFKKVILKILKSWKAFFIKISRQSKESLPFLNNYPL